MDRGRPVGLDRLTMPGGTIAFIPVEGIERVLMMEVPHELVACNLGDDACCGDCARGPIPADKSTTWGADVNCVASVNKNEIRSDGEGRDGLAHGLEGCLQDVDVIDDTVVDKPNPPGKSLIDNRLAEKLALSFGDQFGIANAVDPDSSRKNDGCGDNGSRKSPPSRLVKSCNQTVSRFVQSQLLVIGWKTSLYHAEVPRRMEISSAISETSMSIPLASNQTSPPLSHRPAEGFR